MAKKRSGLRKLYDRVEDARSEHEGRELIETSLNLGLLSVGELRAVSKFNIKVHRVPKKPKSEGLNLFGEEVVIDEATLPDRGNVMSNREQLRLKQELLNELKGDK
jgi:hypothetical protein